MPPALLDQLADGGRLVAPVGDPDGQHLVLLRRLGAEVVRETSGRVRFVPLVPGLRPPSGP